MNQQNPQPQPPNPTQSTDPNANVTVTNPQTGDVQAKVGSEGKPPIKAIRIKTKYLNIEITDPNILEEVNTEGKYATNLPFVGVQITINNKGGRHLIVTEDRKEVVREIVSGISRKEIEGGEGGDQKGLEFFDTDRGSG